MTDYDVIIIGAGAAGMMCAIQAGKRNRRVLVIDHVSKLGGKILISGGGRCNFTNREASPLNYVSNNPHFCKSALTRYPAEQFIQLVEAHSIPFHEKKLGQLFCDHSARDIVALLKSECDEAGVTLKLDCKVQRIKRQPQPEGWGAGMSGRGFPLLDDPRTFQVESSLGTFTSPSLVIATGGLSIPKIGATGFGYSIAKQFGLNIIETAAALDGFTFGPAEIELFRDLSGVSIDCTITSGLVSFRENLLFTHSGLSGPAALQASLHWKKGEPIFIDLLPEVDFFKLLLNRKKEGSRSLLKNILAELLPNRFSDRFSELYCPSTLPLAQISEKDLETFCNKLHNWTLVPSGTVGYSKAEVTRGGVDTDELSSKTMESKKVPGLYFIGEVVDVTGWLGGYNFQWAWASGWASGQAV